MTSMDQNFAVDLYLAPRDDKRTGVPERDLDTAAEIAGAWRRQGPLATAAILHALHVYYGRTLVSLEELTGIPYKTIHRMIEQQREAIGAENV